MIYIIPTDTCFGIACSIEDKTSYDKLYKIKGRPKSKPLAIMIDDFSHLSSLLSEKQINFLKKYNRPWTILIDRQKFFSFEKLSRKIFIENKILNSKNYSKIAFRIANNKTQKKLISEIWPIFLTSANLAWEKEIYEINELKETFKNYKNEIKILAKKDLEKVCPSDIFEFVWDGIDIKYLRKN